MGATMRIPTEFTAIDKFSSVVAKMTSGVSAFSDKTQAAVSRVNQKIGKAANNLAIGGAAIIGPLGLAVNRAVEFEDKMTDVAKTTGLTGKPLEDLGKSILTMSKSSRTGVDDLAKIAEIGGQLGVSSKELVAFTKASNEFNVALGSDFGGVENAISQVGKVKSLFKDTRSLDISTVIKQTGSAINELGAAGNGTSANITDFLLRVGALPDALKPSMKAAAALGTYLEESGVDSQIASSGFSNLVSNIAAQMPRYARELGLSEKAAKDLFAQDPSLFAAKFARTLRGMPADKLALKLNDLKINSLEVTKVLGALSNDVVDPATGMYRLATLTDISSKAIENATSLTDEYNKKNNDTAGKLAQAKNNFDALTITIGTKLLPALNKIIDRVSPLISSFVDWIDKNPDLIIGLAAVGATLWGLSLILKAVQIGIALYNGAIWLAEAAQWAWNVAMAANPIGLIVAAIIGLIALIYVVINKWDQWGAAVSLFMGPLGFVISLIQSFRRNWDMIVNAFKTEGIIGGLKAIGVTILDAVLQPLEQLLSLLAKIPGMGMIIKPALGAIQGLRESMGVNLEGNNAPGKAIKRQLSPEQMNQTIMQQNTLKGGLNVNIRDKGNNVKDTSLFGNSGIPVKVTSTQGSN